MVPIYNMENQGPSSFGPFPNLQGPHPHSQMDRMMHNSSSGQQVRSVFYYSGPPPGCMHQNGPPPNQSTGGYFPLSSGSNSSGPGGSSFVDYHPNHHHHHHQNNHHHGPGMGPSGAGSGSGYRTIAPTTHHHHHSKVMNANQAAALAAYQNAYHQYSQYFHHHQGMMQSIQNHQNGNSDYGWNHNMIGLRVNGGQSMQMRNQPHAHMLPFMNRMGQPQQHAQSMPHFQQQQLQHHHHHHHHGFSGSIVATSQQHQPLLNRLDGMPQLQSAMGKMDDGKSECKSKGHTSFSKDSTTKTIHKDKSKRSSSILKSSSGKISSLEKSSKAKTTKSVTQLRDRPRLVVGQRKKSTISFNGSCSGRKHRSSKTGKRISGSVTESGGLRISKRSKKIRQKESDDDILETVSSASTSDKSECEQFKRNDDDARSKEDLYDGYYLEDGLEEDYVPTPEELLEYLEQLNELNACRNLDISALKQVCPGPELYAPAESEEGDKDSSDCSIDDILEETKCLDCLTWQQQHYNICPTRPPPGFEHLSRPTFPIELYDPTLLGSLIGSQLPRGAFPITMPETYLEEVQEILSSVTCCEKHTIDKLWNMKKAASPKLPVETDEGISTNDDADGVGEWESLDKAIRQVLDDWTEELYFRKKVQQILYGLQLPPVYSGGCCKASNAPANDTSVNASSGKASSAFTPLITREQQSQIRYFIDDSTSLL